MSVSVTETAEGSGREGARSAFLSAYVGQLRGELGGGRLVRLGVIAGEFALLVAAVRLLNIETRSFELVLTLALIGFPVHHLLPAAWRQGFFAALSVASVLVVFGWQQGGWLLAMGCLLIGLCHLPVAFWARVGIIVLVVVAGLLGRAGWLPRTALATGAATLLLLAALDPDARIAEHNLARQGTVPTDTAYLLGLSQDAVPSFSGELRDQACQRHSFTFAERTGRDSDGFWSWNLSRWRADRLCD